MKRFVFIFLFFAATALQAGEHDFYNFYLTKEIDTDRGTGYSARTDLKFDIGIFDNKTEAAVFFAGIKATRLLKGDSVPGGSAEKVIFHLKTGDLTSFSFEGTGKQRSYTLVFKDPKTNEPVTLRILSDGTAKMSLGDRASERQWTLYSAERSDEKNVYADVLLTGPRKVLEPGNSTFVDPDLYFGSKRKSGSKSYSSSSSYRSSESFYGSSSPAKLEQLRPEYEKLLGQATRPTISQLRSLAAKTQKLMPDLPLVLPFAERWKVWSYATAPFYPQFLKIRDQLEASFPNGKFYFLGRDAYLAGDGLDAAFQAIGQEDRVLRLPASAPSFAGVSAEAITGFLESNGIRVEDIDETTSPIVLLDVTSYSKATRSQSRQLMEAAFNKWVSLGRDPRKLAKKLFFVNISSNFGRDQFNFASDRFSIENYSDTVKLVPEPDQLPTLTFPFDTLYATAWYGIYDRIVQQEDGSFGTSSGRRAEEYDRTKILSQLWSFAVDSMKDSSANCQQILGGGF